MSETYNSGCKNGMWKGDNASYGAGLVRAQKIYPLRICERCGLDASERHHKDGNSLNNDNSNVMNLCRKCHMELDGRLQNNLCKGLHRNLKRDLYGRFCKSNPMDFDYPHGSYRGWRNGCRCQSCKNAKADYSKIHYGSQRERL